MRDGYRWDDAYKQTHNGAGRLLSEAQASCDADPTCGAVYDYRCDGRWLTKCTIGYSLVPAPEAGGCIYENPTKTTPEPAEGWPMETGRVCHYNYLSAQGDEVGACQARCLEQPGCNEFSVGGGLGCRYAKSSQGCCSDVPGANINQYCIANEGWNSAGCADRSCQLYSAKVAAPYCVEIVTGTAAHNGGTMDVHIDAGNGLEQAATGKHAKGSTVVHDCFETPVSALQVRNPTNDAWTGAIKYSTDGGTTYRSMMCAGGCQAGQSTDGIVVDGNKDGSGQAATHCLSGATCTITEE